MDRRAIRRPFLRCVARSRPAAALLSLLMAMAASASAVTAITDEEIWGLFRFPSGLPGGRLAAMGGAGLALADDPTAAAINPARLTALGDPALVMEGRIHGTDDRSGDSGQVPYGATSLPVDGTSTEATGATGSSTSASYLGFAWPFPLHRPVVVSAARGEPLDTVIDLRSSTRTIPPTVPSTPGAGDQVLRLSHGHLDVNLETYHFAAGWRLTPTFSVGGALVAGRLSVSSESVGLLWDPLQLTRASMFDPRFSEGQAEPLYRTTSEGTDTASGFVFGTAWRPIPSLALATVYRKGPRFEVPGESRDLATGRRERFDNVLKVPDRAAAGAAWTPFLAHPSATMQSLTFAVDLERIEHSDLLEGLRAGEGILTRPDVARGVSYDVRDSVEARFGVEARRSFPGWTLALRGGLYTAPDRRLRLEGIRDDPNSPVPGQGDALEEGGFLLPDSGTDWHVTLGAGARHYSLSYDLAVDLSDADARVLLTGGWRFRSR